MAAPESAPRDGTWMPEGATPTQGTTPNAPSVRPLQFSPRCLCGHARIDHPSPQSCRFCSCGEFVLAPPPERTEPQRTTFARFTGGRLGLKQVLAGRKFFWAWLIDFGRADLYRDLLEHLGGDAARLRSRWRSKRASWIAAGCPAESPPWGTIEARDR